MQGLAHLVNSELTVVHTHRVVDVALRHRMRRCSCRMDIAIEAGSLHCMRDFARRAIPSVEFWAGSKDEDVWIPHRRTASVEVFISTQTSS
jgi:hypothetical protein